MFVMPPNAAALRLLVRSIWVASPHRDASSARQPAVREHVLPTGDMHLVFRLSGPPLTVFDGPDGCRGDSFGFAIVGGARSRWYAKDVTTPASSIGAQLAPGAAQALFGLPADELCERHTPLDELWGRLPTESALARLHDAATPAARCAVLERIMIERAAVVAAKPLHPAVAWGLRGLGSGAGIADLVAASGFSHRHFVALFRAAVGLAPNRYRQVLRLSRALDALHDEPRLGLAELALRSGFSDQPHFNRAFLEYAGMTPHAYRRAGAHAARHVPVTGQFGSRRTAGSG